MSHPSLSFVIPNLNGHQFLPDCLQSLLTATKNFPRAKYSVILVDNGSTDNSVSIFRQFFSHYPKIDTTVIQNDFNLGFATAVNQGILAAKSDYVALVNNDLSFHPDWLKILLPLLTPDSPYSVWSGTVADKPGRFIESQGLEFFWQGKCLNIHNGKPLSSSIVAHRSSPYSVWGANAAATIYRRQTLLDIGLFDPHFFAYEEDVDLSFRLWRRGFQTLLVPSAITYHLGGGTSRQMSNFRQKMDLKNWHLLILKNYSLTELIRHFPAIFIERLRNLSGLIKSTLFPFNLRLFLRLPYDILSTYTSVLFYSISIIIYRVTGSISNAQSSSKRL